MDDITDSMDMIVEEPEYGDEQEAWRYKVIHGLQRVDTTGATEPNWTDAILEHWNVWWAYWCWLLIFLKSPCCIPFHFTVSGLLYQTSGSAQFAKCRASICEEHNDNSLHFLWFKEYPTFTPKSSQTDTETMEGGNGYLNTDPLDLCIGFSENPPCHAHLGWISTWTSTSDIRWQVLPNWYSRSL